MTNSEEEYKAIQDSYDPDPQLPGMERQHGRMIAQAEPMMEAPKAAIDVAIEELDLDHAALLADWQATADIMPLEEWYLKQVAQLQAAREQIMQHGKRLLSQVASRERALQWAWGRQFKDEIDMRLREQDGKKKSIDTHFGRAGYRTIPGRIAVDVKDEAQAIEALEECCPDAVKKSISKSALNDYVKATGEEVPGVRVLEVEAHESFYPNVTSLLPENTNVPESDEISI